MTDTRLNRTATMYNQKTGVTCRHIVHDVAPAYLYLTSTRPYTVGTLNDLPINKANKLDCM